jgi:hypothetical protein
MIKKWPVLFFLMFGAHYAIAQAAEVQIRANRAAGLGDRPMGGPA